MFTGVNEKLERAGHFLGNLKTLAKDAGGFAHIKREKQQEMRANLDGFFFEIISAKDFFLQGINDKYVHLPKDEGTRIDQLKRCLDCGQNTKALDIVKSIERELTSKESWLWKLNNYRNSATHRELLHLGYVASTALEKVEVYLFADPEDPSKGNADMEVIPYCEQSLTQMKELLERLYSELGLK